jgi:membrane dipeptidase
MTQFKLSVLVAASCALASIAAASEAPSVPPLVAKVLADMPVIDGHNDLPWEIRDRWGSDLGAVDLSKDTSHLPPGPTGPIRCRS